jgi:transposase-like protein
MDRITINYLLERIPTEAAAYELMEKLRWPEKPVCPHCGSINDHYYLKPANGTSRKTRTGNPSERRVWKCKDCRRQFSVLTGTIFHGSKVSLRTWLFVVVEICANRNGIAAREIERKYGVHPKTAWFMTQRIREAMANRNPNMLVGTIVADETWIGPEKRRMNEKGRKRNPKAVKTPVVALINAETGEVRARVVADVNRANLRVVMSENVDMPASQLQTDEAPVYTALGREFARHDTVVHKQEMYVNRFTGASTNKAENFFSQFKRSLDGTHHHVSREHLHRYVDEFAFRHSTHKMADTERIHILMGQTTGRRLSYKRVTG